MFDRLLEKLLKESVVDFPREDLDTTVWAKDGDEYHLRQDVRDKIFDLIRAYPGRDFKDIEDIFSEVRITGSIGTNQYEDDTDIDVHLLPKEGSDIWDDKELQKAVKDWSVEQDLKIGDHPVEVYIQFIPDQDLMSDGCYEVFTDKWLAGPTVVPEDYDPYEDFSELADDVRDEVKDADLQLGELRRDVIDYETIAAAMKKMAPEARKALLTKLKAKLKEIQGDIEELYKTRKGWVDDREEASRPETPEQARKDVALAKAWKDQNAIFKFINRYRYMRVIKDLEALVDAEGGRLKPNDVAKVDKIVGEEL